MISDSHIKIRGSFISLLFLYLFPAYLLSDNPGSLFYDVEGRTGGIALAIFAAGDLAGDTFESGGGANCVHQLSARYIQVAIIPDESNFADAVSQHLDDVI